MSENKKKLPGFVSDLGDIVETVFIKPIEGLDDLDEDHSDDLTNFCVDHEGRIRKGVGFVADDEISENNSDYVPRNRFNVQTNAWNSHDDYVEIELPNPADDFVFYQKIRGAFMTELQRRHELLEGLVRTALYGPVDDFAP